MQNGDLSNKVSPRILLVFEGALGFCTDEKKFSKAVAKGNWDQAFTYWELNELLVRRLLWLFYKKDISTEIVTFLDAHLVDELAALLDVCDLPVHRVWATTPEHLGRQIAYMPDLARVYDPEPERWLMYGGKGRFLTSVAQVGEDVGVERP